MSSFTIKAAINKTDQSRVIVYVHNNYFNNNSYGYEIADQWHSPGKVLTEAEFNQEWQIINNN